MVVFIPMPKDLRTAHIAKMQIHQNIQFSTASLETLKRKWDTKNWDTVHHKIRTIMGEKYRDVHSEQ